MVRGIWTVSEHPIVKGLYGRKFSDMVYVITGIAQTTLEESDEEEEE